MSTKILIVEDQFIEANNLKMILTSAGYEVAGIAPSVAEAMQLIEKDRPHMVLLDIHLRGSLTGIDLAERLMPLDIPFVYLSANSNQQTLDIAKITRPYGFLVKPFRERDVLTMLEIALYRCDMEQSGPLNKKHSSSVAQPAGQGSIVGRSRAIQQVMEQVQVVAATETSVLLLGESGTGKEVVARAIHQASARKDQPFVVLNCAALPEDLIESELFGHEKGSFTGAYEKRVGKFEQANGGTIFLDEIGELPLALQSKFLRVLQEREIESIGGKRRPVDVRIIAATNRNLEKEVSNRRFRMDLYYRLFVSPIFLPALRDRHEDIQLLAEHFVAKFSKKMSKTVKGITPSAMETLLQYSWPGNIRELENIIERTMILTDTPFIEKVTLPPGSNRIIRATPVEESSVKTITEKEREHILMALEKCAWKLSGTDGAAEMLGLNPSTLFSRMKKLGIKKRMI